MSFIAANWAGLALSIGCCLAVSAFADSTPKSAAYFEFGKEVEVLSARIGAKGGVLTTHQSGAPIDGIVVEIPEGALVHETAVTLSYNTGKLMLRSGTASGVCLGLAAPGAKEFEKPVRIRIQFDPVRHPAFIVVGYAVDEKGRIRPITSGPQDVKNGKASFTTLVPLHFTWVYN